MNELKETLWHRGELIERLVKAVGHLPPAQMIYAIVGCLPLSEAKRVTEVVEELSKGK